ncbi:hypothetical protein TNCV_3274291 [Trichonephila clavipes]|nr:hypothetical protein TNCV_3274291 [Trichonephila clavipes]
MSRSDGQSEAEPPVFKSPSKLGTHLSTHCSRDKRLGPPCPARYSMAFGDGPRHFESWSSDEDDACADSPSLNYHTTPTGGRLSSR